VALLKARRGGRRRVRSCEEAFAQLVLRFAGPARSDGGRAAHGVLRVFVFAERLASLGHHKQPLYGGGVLSYEIERFTGRPLPLADQADIRAGEPVVVLHWQNQRGLTQLTRRSESRRAAIFQANELMKADLLSLAELARSGAFRSDVRAVWAETILYPLLARYGFETRVEPPSLRTKLLRIYFLGLFASYGLDGLVRARRGRTGHFHLGEAWIAIEDLSRRFPAQ
jgi:hypothetical protein